MIISPLKSSLKLALMPLEGEEMEGRGTKIFLFYPPPH
jgi:hypothetical protein